MPKTTAFSLALALAGAACSGTTVEPIANTDVDPVVAVVGEQTIHRTELVRRAEPTRNQNRSVTQDPHVASQEHDLYKEVLQKMIDERLEAREADKAHISVSPDEIDTGISGIAAKAQEAQHHSMTAQQVLERVAQSGVSAADFREEVRRQIMEGKLIELRVRPHLRVTETDARAAYAHWVQLSRAQDPQKPMPEYEDVKDEMMRRATLDALQRGYRQWLDELRQNVHIDVRL